MSKEPIWVGLKDLIKVLQKYDVWSFDTKYLNIYLDTRFINGDYGCTIKTRDGNEYLSIEDLIEKRKIYNPEVDNG